MCWGRGGGWVGYCYTCSLSILRWFFNKMLTLGQENNEEVKEAVRTKSGQQAPGSVIPAVRPGAVPAPPKATALPLPPVVPLGPFMPSLPPFPPLPMAPIAPPPWRPVGGATINGSAVAALLDFGSERSQLLGRVQVLTSALQAAEQAYHGTVSSDSEEEDPLDPPPMRRPAGGGMIQAAAMPNPWNGRGKGRGRGKAATKSGRSGAPNEFHEAPRLLM